MCIIREKQQIRQYRSRYSYSSRLRYIELVSMAYMIYFWYLDDQNHDFLLECFRCQKRHKNSPARAPSPIYEYINTYLERNETKKIWIYGWSLYQFCGKRVLLALLTLYLVGIKFRKGYIGLLYYAFNVRVGNACVNHEYTWKFTFQDLYFLVFIHDITLTNYRYNKKFFTLRKNISTRNGMKISTACSMNSI